MSYKVSIIVPTKDSAEFLDRALINLMEQNYPNKEIIVVDNFSKDATPQIAKRWADKFYQVGPERTAQANYGIDKAEGEIIYLTGSDMLRDSDYIRQGVEKMLLGYDAVYASVLTDCRVKHFWGRIKALERQCYIGTEYESARMFWKNIWTVRGGFDDRLIQMEEDFQHRLDKFGYRTCWMDAREYHLHEDDSLAKVFRKSFYYGGFMGAYLDKHKRKGVKFLMPVRSCFLTNWRRLASHPLLTAGLVMYKLVQYLGGIMGVLNAKR